MRPSLERSCCLPFVLFRDGAEAKRRAGAGLDTTGPTIDISGHPFAPRTGCNLRPANDPGNRTQRQTEHAHGNRQVVSGVGGNVVRRIVEVSSGAETQTDLLSSVGLSVAVPVNEWSTETVEEDAYYELLERATGDHDFALPFRYAEGIDVDDFAALGLALKTASTVRDSLSRLVRYILVLSDTLEYELRDEVGGGVLILSRPGHRRGAELANECALAAVTSIMRQITHSHVVPFAVSFRHPRPASDEPHRDFFGCPVRFEDRVNGLHLSTETLEAATRLGDEGLSAFILANLDDMKDELADRTIAAQVFGVVTDSLPDGRPSKSQIARRLGMSERTLHRRLAEHGQTFQSIANRAQREAAESLLTNRNNTLAEVAFLTGFSDQSAFTRAFKGWTGQTPLSFRESSPAL